jgi:hypothetical protein
MALAVLWHTQIFTRTVFHMYRSVHHRDHACISNFSFARGFASL